LLTDLKRAVLLTISAPIKPGSVHRLMGDVDFERRLLEYVAVEPHLEEAYRRGRALGEGKLSAQELGLGEVLARALKDSFESSGETPLVGLWSAAVTAAAMVGYSSASNVKMYESLRTLITRILYSSLPDDVIDLVEGIGDSGDVDLLEHLSRRNLTENYVKSNGLSLGDAFELLSEVDKGFSINLKGYEWLLGLTRLYEGLRSPLAGVVRVYLAVASELSKSLELLDLSKRHEIDPSQLLRADRQLSSMRGSLNRSLGAVFLSLFLAMASGKAPRGF